MAMTEEEAERLAQMRRSVASQRAAQERAEERRRQQEQLLADDWRRYSEEATARSKETRAHRLAQLEHTHAHRQPREEEARRLRAAAFGGMPNDEEFQFLIEKYGDRLRVPAAPPARLHDQSTTSSRSSQMPRSLVAAGVASAATPRVAPDLAEGSTMGRQPAEDFPPMDSARSALGQRGSSSSGAKRRSVLETLRRRSVSPPSRDATAHLVVPRKNMLRKKQAQLLKNADVAFYRPAMKKQFQRILEAVEQPAGGNQRMKPLLSPSVVKMAKAGASHTKGG